MVHWELKRKHPLCCGVGKIEFVEKLMFSAAIIGSNYVRYDAKASPDHQYGTVLKKINSPWIIVMTASHACINTRGKMYDSSVLACSNEWPTGNHSDWLQAPYVKNLAPWSPTNRCTNCCPKMSLFTVSLSYINRIFRFFCNSHFKSVNLKPQSDERLRPPTTCDYLRPAVIVGSRSDFYHNRTSSHTLRSLYDWSSIIVAFWSLSRMQVADCCTTIVRPSYDSLRLSAICHNWSYDRLQPSYDDRATT